MTVAPLWVGTSWKMTKTLGEAVTFIDELAAHPIPPELAVFVLPAHTALATVRDRLPEDSPIMLGAQNAHWAAEGAGTGEISMRMAADAGASIVELGHSERRTAFGETDETVAAKTAAALEQGLVPLVCVGEPREVRTSGEDDAAAFVEAQVRGALSRVPASEVAKVIIAYEPVWAIGHQGTPARQDQIAPVMARIGAVATELSQDRAARAVLYGGGVDADNLSDLLSDPHTDGVFVGRAGWSAAGFIRLLLLAEQQARRRQTETPDLMTRST